MRRTPARRPTIKDIARRAGVSESAVSFALNGRPGVSAATRDRVRRVAEQLGWQPSTAARALSGEGSATVGLVLARPARTLGVESFFLQLVSGVQEALAARRLGLLFQVVEDTDAECALYRRWWAEHRVDGLLVVDPRDGDPRPALLAELGLPAVLIGAPPATAPPRTAVPSPPSGPTTPALWPRSWTICTPWVTGASCTSRACRASPTPGAASSPCAPRSAAAACRR
ncbi:hypothetical protein GCM10020000_10410 [Streptomyces olivoverticillatus]